MTEASEFDSSQLSAAGSASESVAFRRHRHTHGIRKTGGVLSSDSSSVGMDAVELCAATSEGDKGGMPVADAVDAAVGDEPGVRRRGNCRCGGTLALV